MTMGYGVYWYAGVYPDFTPEIVRDEGVAGSNPVSPTNYQAMPSCITLILLRQKRLDQLIDFAGCFHVGHVACIRQNMRG